MNLRGQLPASIVVDPHHGCVHAASPLWGFKANAYKEDGFKLTAHGDLKILMVFVRFPEDDWMPEHEYWPINGLPIWVHPGETGAGTLLAPLAQYPNFAPPVNSLSEFYYDMSKHSFAQTGKQPLRMFGDMIAHTYTRTRANVAANGITPGAAACEILQAITLPNPPPNSKGFNQYDNWSFGGEYLHANVPDANPKMIDLVIICWRNIERGLNQAVWPWDGDPPAGVNIQVAKSMLSMNWHQPSRAQIRWASAEPEFCQTEVVNGVPVNADLNYSSQPHRGTSIWCSNFLENPGEVDTRYSGVKDRWFRLLVHEIGHHLIGPHWSGGPWNLVANGSDRSYMPSALEMANLGWTAPKHIIRKNGQTNNLHVELGDLYETGDFVQIEINEAEDRWYFLENHQLISKWDNPISDLRTTAEGRLERKGLYLLYGRAEHYSQSLISSTGATTWPVWRNEFHWGKWRPVFKKPELREESALLGFTKSELIPLNDADRVLNVHPSQQTPEYNAVHLVDVDGDVVDVAHHDGGGAPDMFSEDCGRRLWTIGTNPGSHYTARQRVGQEGQRTVSSTVHSTDASFLILDRQSNGTLTLRIDQGASALPNIDDRPPHLTIDGGDVFAHGSQLALIVGEHNSPYSEAVSSTVDVSWPLLPGVEAYNVAFANTVLATSVTSVPASCTFSLPANAHSVSGTLCVTPVHDNGTVVGCRPLEVNLTVSRDPGNSEKRLGSGASVVNGALKFAQNEVHVRATESAVVAELTGPNTTVRGIHITDVSGRVLAVGRHTIAVVGGKTVVTIPLKQRVVGLLAVTLETSRGAVFGTTMMEAP